MADVFISYASADRAAAQRIGEALERAGLTTWWDRHIKGGSEFSRDIETQLDAARHVLVLWSKESIASRWVRDEASVAADTGRLVGASIDGTPAPLGFRQFQTLDLKAFASRGGSLPADLAEALDAEPAQPRSASAPARSRRPLWIAGAVAALLALVAAVWVVRPGPFTASFGEAKHQSVALAVMPFATSGGNDVAYLGPGLSGALSAALAQLPDLALTSSTSTQAVAAQNLTAPEIGQKLGISHLVEGDVRKLGDQLGIAVRLVDAASSQQVWQKDYRGSADQLPLIRQQMGDDLAAAMQARLGIGQGALTHTRDIDPRAFDAYLRGVEQLSLRYSDQARNEAIRQFRLASSMAPDFADAHAGLAYTLGVSLPFQIDMSWDEIKREQRQAADRALALDPDNLLALTAKAVAFHNFDGDVERSMEISRDVLRRAPDFGPAHYTLASSLAFAGLHREAQQHYDRAIERDPFNRILHSARTGTLIDLGDYEGSRSILADCQGDCYREAYQVYEAMLGFANADQMERDLPGLLERSPLSEKERKESDAVARAVVLDKPYAGPLDDHPDLLIAALNARFGRADKAFDNLRRSVAAFHPDSVMLIMNSGRLQFPAALRADPRYHAIFRDPKLAKIVEVRRRNKILDGLPVFPVKPLTS